MRERRTCSATSSLVKRAPPVRGEKTPHPLQGGGVESFAHLVLPRLRVLLPAHQLVNGLLVQALLVPLRQVPPLDKFIQRLTEAGEGKWLHQVVQHAPGQQPLDDLPVIRRGDHNDGRILPRGVEAVHKLHPVHGWGVVV